jgi:phosphoglucosamine mutase
VNLFGTDGIRGRVEPRMLGTEEAINALADERLLSPTLAWLVASAAARTFDDGGASPLAVVGWDRRPGNPALVRAVTHALRTHGWRVLHLGACATPLVHRVVIAEGATLGVMVTASHNPAHDSGLKLFDAEGRKSTPSMEVWISELVLVLAQEDHPLGDLERDPLATPDNELDDAALLHASWLDERHRELATIFGLRSRDLSIEGGPLLLDASGGAARTWLAAWLSERGCPAVEVSASVGLVNDGCGAGDFSPGQRWTWGEVEASNHLLLRRLVPVPAGRLVAAALDGDGDRCLLLQSTETGVAVVDGDAMALSILRAASTSGPWTLAASIESDLALSTSALGMKHVAAVHPTAVGDRWLSVALHSAVGPCVLGVEDSGHLVLPWRHQGQETVRLVGDGAASLVAVLLAGCGRLGEVPSPGGWKLRRSIAPSDRSRWTGTGPLAEAVVECVRRALPDVEDLEHGPLDNEPNLLRVEGRLGAAYVSLGVRNSGTQAKTSISLRTDAPALASRMLEVMDQVEAVLRPALVQ